MQQLGKEIIFNSISLSKGNEYKNTRLVKKQKACLNNLKIISDDTLFDQFFEEIAKNKSSAHYINGNLFPKDDSMIAKYYEIGFTKKLVYEIRWNFKVFEYYTSILNSFIDAKEQYDRLILLGNYQEALYLLEYIFNEFGYSLWYAENKAFLNKALGDKQASGLNNGLVSSLFRFWEMRSASEVSSRDYYYYVKREIAKFMNIYPKAKSLASFYTYLLAPQEYEMSETGIMYILEHMYKMPLVDRYLFFLDVLEYSMIQDDKNELRKTMEKYSRYLQRINDRYILTFLFIISNKTDRNIIKAEMSDIEIKNMFIEGRLIDARNALKKAIKNDPRNIDNINLYITITQMLHVEIDANDFPEIIKSIIEALTSIYSLDEKYNDSIDMIYKVIFSCIHSKWARKIHNSIMKNCQPLDSVSQITATRYYYFGELGVEMMCEWLPSDEVLYYFEDNNVFDTPYLEVRKECLKNDYIEAIKYSGNEYINKLMRLEKCYDFSAFRPILNDPNISAIYLNRVAKIMWRNMKSGKYFDEAIDYFLKQFFIREEYAFIAPLDDFLNYVLHGNLEEKAELRTPILLYVYSNYFDKKRTSDLTIVCEDFFFYNNIEKPSEMDFKNIKYDNSQLIYFLRYVCIPQILGPVLLSLRSTKELDKERINICQYLMQIDPDNEKEYEQEIQEITQKLVVNEGLVSIENSKIHVNTNGIKSRISKNLRSDFNNYMYYRNNALNPIIEQLKDVEGINNYTFIAFDSVQLFEEIVRTIRNEFVSGGEYGLDGYLSINIRHGTLEGEIKAPLAKYDLLTQYLSETQQWEVNSRWLYKITNPLDAAYVRDAIIELNQGVEEIIKYLKNTLIQVSTEEKKTEGIFDYSLSYAEIQSLKSYIMEDTTFEKFIDVVFEYLWQKTEYNLEKMQDIIRNEISHKFVDRFSKLTQIYKTIDAKIEFPEAVRWLNEVQIDVDNALNRIGLWFRRSPESKSADFELDLAFQIGLQMIKNIHPKKEFEVIELKKAISNTIAGDYLRNYRDIFYTLFDNISAYAMPVDDVIRIWCELEVDDSHVLIRMTNDYDCSQKIEKNKKRLDSELQLLGKGGYLAKAKQEGGSGIPKIYKVMSVDLMKVTEIDYIYDTENNKFSIIITGRGNS